MRGPFMRQIRRIGSVWLCNFVCVRRTASGQLVQSSGCVDIFAYFWHLNSRCISFSHFRLHVYQI